MSTEELCIAVMLRRGVETETMQNPEAETYSNPVFTVPIQEED